MQRHIILTGGRSGSNFLVNTLNYHPSIVNLGEVLGKWTVAYKLRYAMNIAGFQDHNFLEALLHNKTLFYCAQVFSASAHFRRKEPIRFKRIKNIESIGIKEFFFHFQRFRLEEFLLQNPDIRVIHLNRKNLLRRCLSLQSLQERKVIFTRGELLELGKMHVNPEEMLHTLDVLHQESEYEHQLIRRLNQNPILSLSYEKSFSTPESLQAMMNQVFTFLDVSPIEQISSHRKILSHSLNEIVENYEELVEALQSTRYAEYLD